MDCWMALIRRIFDPIYTKKPNSIKCKKKQEFEYWLRHWKRKVKIINQPALMGKRKLQECFLAFIVHLCDVIRFEVVFSYRIFSLVANGREKVRKWSPEQLAWERWTKCWRTLPLRKMSCDDRRTFVEFPREILRQIFAIFLLRAASKVEKRRGPTFLRPHVQLW